MHLAQRHLDAIRRLLTRHADTGQVPSAEIRVVLAELEATLDAPSPPPSELAALAERTTLDRVPTPTRPSPETPRP